MNFDKKQLRNTLLLLLGALIWGTAFVAKVWAAAMWGRIPFWRPAAGWPAHF